MQSLLICIYVLLPPHPIQMPRSGERSQPKVCVIASEGVWRLPMRPICLLTH